MSRSQLFYRVINLFYGNTTNINEYNSREQCTLIYHFIFCYSQLYINTNTHRYTDKLKLYKSIILK